MRKYFEWKEGERRAVEPYLRTPMAKRLKYAALSSIGLGIILMVVTILNLDRMSWRTFAVLRGSTGVCAIVFAILVAIRTYIVYKAYFRERHKRVSERRPPRQ